MKILGINSSLWYKSAHVFFACAWFGSVLAVIIIYLFSSDQEPVLFRHNSQLMERIDKFIIIPSSLLCYATGILISWKTNWGFFKYKWVVVKLIIGTSLILFGIFFLGPWIMAANTARDNEMFIAIQNKLGASMIGQAIVIATTIVISTIKPWGKLKI